MSSTKKAEQLRLRFCEVATREHIEPWRRVALDAADDLMDRETVTDAIHDLYRAAGYDVPKALFCGSVRALETTYDLIGMRSLVPRHEKRSATPGRERRDLRPGRERRAAMRQTVSELSPGQWAEIVANVRRAPLRAGSIVFNGGREAWDFSQGFSTAPCSDQLRRYETRRVLIDTIRAAGIEDDLLQLRRAAASVARADCARNAVVGIADLLDPKGAELGWGPELGIQAELSRAGGTAIFCRNVALIAERHDTIRRDSAGRLHCADGPALVYPDGEALYALHGVQVPRALLDEVVTVERIDGEENLEIRRLLIDKYGGLERYIADTAAVEVARDSCGVLLKRFYPKRGDTLAVVRVVNSTPEPDGSRREYLLRVPPRTETAREGVAWTFGLQAGEYRPQAET